MYLSIYIILKIYFSFNYVDRGSFMYTHKCRCLQSSEGSIGSPAAGKQPDFGAGNQT